MKYYNKSVKRVIKNVDYIPVQLRTEKECQATAYDNIRKGDRSSLELALNDKDAIVCRITLLICENYHRISELYRIPNEHRDGDVLIENHGETDSQVFRCEIFENAVKVVVSDIVPHDCIVSENVVWELSERGDLVSLCILEPTGGLPEHCFKELEANK